MDHALREQAARRRAMLWGNVRHMFWPRAEEIQTTCFRTMHRRKSYHTYLGHAAGKGMPRAFGPITLDNLPRVFGPRALDDLLRASAARASGKTHTEYRAPSDHALYVTWRAPSGQALGKTCRALSGNAQGNAPPTFDPRDRDHMPHAFGPGALETQLPSPCGHVPKSLRPYAFEPRAGVSAYYMPLSHAQGGNICRVHSSQAPWTTYHALSGNARWATHCAPSGHKPREKTCHTPSEKALGETRHAPLGQAPKKDTTRRGPHPRGEHAARFRATRSGTHATRSRATRRGKQTHAHAGDAPAETIPRASGPRAMDNLPNTYGPRARERRHCAHLRATTTTLGKHTACLRTTWPRRPRRAPSVHAPK